METTSKTPIVRASVLLISDTSLKVDLGVLLPIPGSQTWSIGDFVGQSLMHHKNCGWQLSVAARPSFEIEPSVCELLSIIESWQNVIASVVEKHKLYGEFSIDVNVRGQMPAIHLSSAALNRMNVFGFDVDVDLV